MDPIDHPSLSLPTTLSSASQGADTLSDLMTDHVDHRLDASLPLLDTPPSPDQGAHTRSDLMAAQPSASSAPQVQHTKRPLTPSYDLPAKAKRPCNLVHPVTFGLHFTTQIHQTASFISSLSLTLKPMYDTIWWVYHV